MAVIDQESFAESTAIADYTAYNLLASVGGLGVTIQTAGPLGDNYVKIQSLSGFIKRNIPSSLTTFFFGARIGIAQGNVVALAHYLEFYSVNGTAQFTVGFNDNTQVITVLRGSDAGTVLGTSAPLVFPIGGSFFYVEIGATLSTTVGTVTVKINGATVISLTGVNNQNDGASATLAQWAVQNGPGLVNTGDMYFAHYYLTDATGPAPWNTYLGDVRVMGVFPTSNGTVAFTPNGLGTNWQNAAKVNPVPATDFNSDASVGASDLFNTAGIPAGLGQVYSAAVKMLALKTDAGLRQMATLIKSGTVISSGATKSVGVSALYYSSIYQTDPNTTAQWSNAAIDAAQPGYVIIA